MVTPIEKRTRLHDPVATTGDRVYCICSQNGLFPDPWEPGHVPHEQWGVWNHPIKLLDGFWLAVRNPQTDVTRWLMEAELCRVAPTYTEFEYTIGPLQIVRRDFVPDSLEGMMVTVTVHRPAQDANTLELLLAVRSDLRPAWLGEQVGMVDGTDDIEVDRARGIAIVRDARNPWCSIIGADSQPTSIVTEGSWPAFASTVGKGANVCLTLPVTWQCAEDNQDQRASHTFFMAGSSASARAAHDTLVQMREQRATIIAEKEQRYAEIFQTCCLTTPEPRLNQAFAWSKINCQRLVRQTDDYSVEKYGPLLGAGLPTYPWWFGIDSTYAARAMAQSGLGDLVKAQLRLLKEVSLRKNGAEPGRVIHELTTTGVIFNPGNLVETPDFTRAIYSVWRWTGDDDFLREMYPFCKQGTLDYTLGQCDEDGDLCPAGRSIIETVEMHAGFECVDVAAYTWAALGQLAEMAEIVGDDELSTELWTKAAQLGDCLRTAWWLDDEGLFADVRASVNEVVAVLARLDTLAAEHPDAQQQVTQAHHFFAQALNDRADAAPDVDLPWLLRHWVTLCPLEVEVATPTQARRALARLTSAEFCNDWGMYLHPERHDVMSINTGLLALSLLRYGHFDDGLRFVRRMADTLTMHMPGAISEALPDQWCFMQLWSIVGIASPLIEGVLGIVPDAGRQHLRVTPRLPAGWSEMNLAQIPIGKDHCDVHVEIAHGTTTVRVNGAPAGWQVTLGIYVPDGMTITRVMLNQAPLAWRFEETTRGRFVLCQVASQAELSLVVFTQHLRMCA